jgi:KDO2-lipid IV(A) lauroyltransferase
MLLRVLQTTVQVLRILPPAVAWRLGAGLGDLAGRLPLRDVRRCREHLARAFPERPTAWHRRTTHGCFRHFGATSLWTLATWTRDAASLRRGIVVEGAEHLRAAARAARRGEGAIAFAGHFGNWELIARVLGGLLPLTVIGKRLRHPAFDRLVQDHRAQGGAGVVYQDGDIRDLVRLLRQGRIIATLADQDVPDLAGCFVPWFGEAAYTPVAPAALALLARTDVQCCHLYRHHGRWILHLSPRLRFPRGPDRVADQLAITAWATAYEEALVRRHPEQWVWWHKRWRTRPEGLQPSRSLQVNSPAAANGAARIRSRDRSMSA